LINGLLIGLAIGLGAWGQEALRIARLPVSFYLPSLLLGIALVVVLCGLVGWLTGRLGKPLITVPLWALTGVLSMFIMAYLPFYGRSLTVWLIDSRFWGRAVFPFTLEATSTGLVLGSFLIVLTLAGLGILQSYRLENIASESDQRGRLKARGWVSLLLPLPLVFLAAMVTQNVRPNPAAAAAELVNRAIPRAQAYEGDLRELNEDGISYAAFRPVQTIIDGDYTLSIVDVNTLTSTVIIGVEFAGGNWVYCRVISGQLNFCYDAAPPYTTGLRSLITGGPLPEECRNCALAATDAASAWLAEHRDQLGSEPAVERVAQQGSDTLMRLTGVDGFTAECWIVGVAPAELIECKEISG
jgi:hypothetical protein